MGKILLTLMACFSAMCMLDGQTTLDMVLLQVKEQAPESRIKKLIPEKMNFEVDNLKKRRLPQLGISGQATYQSDVTFLDVNVPGVEIPAPDNFQYKLQGEVNQILYDGGAIAAHQEAALIGSLVEDAQTDMQLEQIRKNAIELYFSIIELEEVVNSLSLKRQDLEARLSTVEAGVVNGVVLESELLNLKAAILELDQQVESITTQKQSLTDHLSVLSGTEYDNDTDFLLPEDMENVDVGQGALAYHRLINHQARGVETTQKIKDTASKPKLSAFGQFGVGRPGLNFLDESLDEYYIVGMRLQMSFSNLYSKSNDRQINRIKKEMIESNKESYDRQWRSGVYGYQNDLARYQVNITSNSSLLELRSDIRAVAQAQLENGVITSADYILRLNEENIARINLKISEIRKIKTQYLLQHHTGNYQR